MKKNSKTRLKKSSIIFYIILSVLVIFLLVNLFLNIFVFSGILVQKSSMYPTLKDGDNVIMIKDKEAKRGDIVIIEGEENDKSLWIIKRVIAIGGDTIRFENGLVFLKKDGEEEFTQLEEDYIEGNITYYPNVNNPNSTDRFDFSVPDGEYFYMGDNRMNSLDSRQNLGLNTTFGTCSKDQILGVVPNWSVTFKGYFNFIFSIKKLFIKND